MLNYLLGASHTALACCALYLLYLAPAPSPSPLSGAYAVQYVPDCYLSFPNEEEITALPLTLDQLVEITYESPKP